MRALNNAGLLTLWESGHGLYPIDRGLLAIQAAFPDAVDESVADWPLGKRNQALAQLHADCFGVQLQGWTDCRACGEKLEFAIDCRALIARQRERGLEPIVVKGQTFRVPTSRDLARIAAEHDSNTAALRLLDVCRLEDTDEGNETEAGLDVAWSQDELAELGEKMIQADPLAEISLRFDCPTCKSTSDQMLDLPAFFWAELEAYAGQLLEDIHTLAGAYGWSEAEILAMSDVRRAAYLRMVRA